MRRNSFLVAWGVALLLGLSAIPAFGVPTPHVDGGGSGILPGPFAGDRLYIELTARALPGGTAQGRFHITHIGASGGLVGEVSGEVDCLIVSGDQASVTGEITSGRLTEFPDFDPSGQTAAITIIDDPAGDVFGFDLSFFPEPHTISACQATGPFVFVDQGNYSVF